MYHHPIPDGVGPSEAAYRAVAAVKECDILELPPLGQVIDTDGLDALSARSPSTEGLSIVFEYADCSVTITATDVRVDCH